MFALLRRLFGGGPAAPAFAPPGEDAFTHTDSGLAHAVVRPGEGSPPTAHDTVTVRYAGWTLDGRRFDASYPGTARFPLDRVVRGWTEGLQLLRPGGAAWLVLPPHLAYGSRGAPPRIGPGATLVFYVELERVG